MKLIKVVAADNEASERSLLQVHPHGSVHHGKAHSFGGTAMGKAPLRSLFCLRYSYLLKVRPFYELTHIVPPLDMIEVDILLVSAFDD